MIETNHSWGNTQVNTTTKPLFEETLDIILECFDKHKHNRPFLPITCLKDYQLIYNESDDAESILRDDNQVYTERTSTRYLIRDSVSRASFASRALPRINTSRTSTTTETETSTTSEAPMPVLQENEVNKNISSTYLKEFINPPEPETEKQRLMRLKSIREKYTFRIQTRALKPVDDLVIKRSLSSDAPFPYLQRKKRIDLNPLLFNNKRTKQQQKTLKRSCIIVDKKENMMIIEEAESEQQIQSTIICEDVDNQLPTTDCPVN